MKQVERAKVVQAIRREVERGATVRDACRNVGVSAGWYARWSARMDEAGMDGLADLARTGRPPAIELTQEEVDYLRKAYLRSNLRDGAGSMTLAARWAAKEDGSPLRTEVREAILAERSSKHALPIAVRRACRACGAEVRRYRDNKAGQNDGIYLPGWLRMAEDGSRRLYPGERQVWDDATVNVGVVVPWARGGDKCSERWGVRIARFQLLLGLDCATDMVVGYSYVMRANDAYGAADVVSALHKVWQLAGYAPKECVMEGGAWQAGRTLDFLSMAGVGMISAKGRPNQKLVEGFFNRLWTVLSVSLPAGGQVGRFRGEMAAENDLWRRCREGVEDPRLHFPLLTEFLGALDRGITYLNDERMESREYGSWVPAEVYKGQAEKGQRLVPGLWRFALPVREERVISREGMVRVRCESPFGWPHTYHFASDKAWEFEGAPVIVSFDPEQPGRGAILELARRWNNLPAGRVIDEAAACISAAPELVSESGRYACRAMDGRDEGRMVKRSARAKIGAQVAAYDERGVRARHSVDADGQVAAGVRGGAERMAPVRKPVVEEMEPDWAAMEADAGILVG